MGDDGEGAEEWAAALEAAEASPLAADDSLEPFVIGLPNLEGDPGGTFPDVGEGAQAAVQFINEKLGGIGADLEAGTPGRPIELRVLPARRRPERGAGLRQRGRQTRTRTSSWSASTSSRR